MSKKDCCNNPEKILLVEGFTEQRVIPELAEANGIEWERDDKHCVCIEESGGFANMVQPGFLSVKLKQSNVRCAGIIADANSDAESRFESIKNRCKRDFPTLPEKIEPDGLIRQNTEGKKLGIWLMPDNESHGMLETFLTYLIPSQQDKLVKYAKEARDKAKDMGAPFKDKHKDKAHIYTWLAWQDEPGRQLHQAVKEKVLAPRSPYADPFLRWFRNLFEV